MISSNAFAQYHRKVLSVGKDLEFQKCSFQRRQNTDYSGVVQYSSASVNNRRSGTSVKLRLLKSKSFPLFPSLVTLPFVGVLSELLIDLYKETTNQYK